MKQLEQLFNRFYIEIDDFEYMEYIEETETGYISLLSDIELDELLNYFIHVNLEDIKVALYNGTLHFYKYDDNYIAVLES